MREQFGKPNNSQTGIQKIPGKPEKIPSESTLADLLQRRKSELHKTDPQIAEELSEILGYKVSKSSVLQWGHRYNPYFPEESKLQAIAEAYELPLAEVKTAREEGLAAREKFTGSRKSTRVPKANSDYDGYGEGSLGRIARSAKRPKAP